MKRAPCPAGGRHQWAKFTQADVRDDAGSVYVKMFGVVDIVVTCRKCRHQFSAQVDSDDRVVLVNESNPVGQQRGRGRRRQGSE